MTFLGSATEKVAELSKKIADLYEELVTNTVRFEHLEKSTDKTLADFKGALERMSAKLDTIAEQHVREQSAMAAKIEALDGKLQALSQQALHAVAKDAAREMMREQFRSVSTDHVSSGKAALPPDDGGA